MPLLNKTKTMESTFSTSIFSPLRLSRTITLVQGRDNPPGGVMAYLRQELPSGANSIPLAAYAFMSGYVSCTLYFHLVLVAHLNPSSTPSLLRLAPFGVDS
jgi:hypothetical protein